MKTFAAFAWGARFKSASVPYCVVSAAPSLRFANSSTGSPWSFALSSVRAEKAQARFAGREPVDALAEVAEKRHVHLAEQFLDESWADGRVVVEKTHRSVPRPGERTSRAMILPFHRASTRFQIEAISLGLTSLVL